MLGAGAGLWAGRGWRVKNLFALALVQWSQELGQTHSWTGSLNEAFWKQGSSDVKEFRWWGWKETKWGIRGWRLRLEGEIRTGKLPLMLLCEWGGSVWRLGSVSCSLWESEMSPSCRKCHLPPVMLWVFSLLLMMLQEKFSKVSF